MSETTAMTWAPRWGAAKVSGESMLPTLHPGDVLLVRHRPDTLRPGRLAVVELADGTIAVKRAIETRRTATGADGWWVLSDNPSVGVDSRHRGPVPRERVLAVVVARLWPRPGRLRTRRPE